MENKKRLVDVKEAKLHFRKVGKPAEYNGVIHHVVPISEIDKIPTIDAVEVVHGRWKEYQVPHIMCCSECDWATGVQDDFNYCPNCGAKMDGDENE